MTKLDYEGRKRKDRAKGNSIKVKPAKATKRQKVVAARSAKKFAKIRERMKRPGLLQMEAENFEPPEAPYELIKARD